jgi:predicted kinase
MSKKATTRPILFLLYGMPGSGKTAFARQITADLQVVHVSPEKIRHELFQNPSYDEQEQIAVEHLVRYMTREFLSYGMSVILDINLPTAKSRRAYQEMANEFKVAYQLLWFQIDTESAKSRAVKRDRRKTDDKFSYPITSSEFDEFVANMQPPKNSEEYVVISGKHTFDTQSMTLLKRLQLLGMLEAGPLKSGTAKPNLVNLVTGFGGRYDPDRRISIR